MFGFLDCTLFSLFRLRSKFKDVLSALKECYKEFDDGSMTIDLCLEEVLEEEKSKKCEKAKYKQCRNVYVCTAKKLGLFGRLKWIPRTENTGRKSLTVSNLYSHWFVFCSDGALVKLDAEGRLIPKNLHKYRCRVDDKEEFDKVYKVCKRVEGTGADAVINALQCIVRTSTKARKKAEEVRPYLKKYL